MMKIPNMQDVKKFNITSKKKMAFYLRIIEYKTNQQLETLESCHFRKMIDFKTFSKRRNKLLQKLKAIDIISDDLIKEVLNG